VEVVSIKDARPGQIVMRAVTNQAGVVLCPEGQQLTERLIERLRAAGVVTLVVEGSRKTGPSVAERLEQLERRFRGVKSGRLLEVKAAVERCLQASMKQD